MDELSSGDDSAYVGEIRMFSYLGVPEFWLPCDGTKYSISEYPTLYALLGTKFGGDGNVTFAVPDLRGRVAVSQGPSAASQTNYQLGQQGGSETESLTMAQTAPHNHALAVNEGPANMPFALSSYPGIVIADNQAPPVTPLLYASAAPDVLLNQSMIGLGGSSTSSSVGHNNIQPSIIMTYAICAFGTWPPRP